MTEIHEGGRANTRTNWTFSWNKELGDTGVHVSYILNENYANAPEPPNQAGTFIEQTKDGLPRGADGMKVPHPTIENVYVGYDNYVLSEGVVTYSAEWDAGDISTEQMDDYVAWLQAENFGNHVQNLTRTDTTLSWDFVPKDETGGPYTLVRYQPDSKFKVTISSDIISMACLLRPENQADVWNTCSYSIRSGESLTINKQGQECWLAYVGHDFVADGAPVAIGAFHDMTSDTISITNNATGVRKVAMLWK